MMSWTIWMIVTTVATFVTEFLWGLQHTTSCMMTLGVGMIWLANQEVMVIMLMIPITILMIILIWVHQVSLVLMYHIITCFLKLKMNF